MSATGLVSAQQPFHGLRPVNLRRDLGEIADLIELCFGPTLDSSGRSAIQEMRIVSRSGPILWLVNRLGHAIPFMRGFVWIEGDGVVGNVSITPAGFGQGWVIANVAVHPTYRRRGIARQLMQASLAQIMQQGAFATLQVDADNDHARRLYETLGFRSERTFTRWRRSSHLRPPEPLPDLPPIRRATRGQAEALYTLAQRVRPNLRGGLGWLRPTEPAAVRPSRLAGLRYFLSGRRRDFWIVPAGDETGIDAALAVEQRMGGMVTAFDLLVERERRGDLDTILLNFLLRRFEGRHVPVVTDHPADDDTTGGVLHDHFFRPERTLVHMVWPVPGKE